MEKRIRYRQFAALAVLRLSGSAEKKRLRYTPEETSEDSYDR